jgi:membrane protein implicated in regulation of membrane protease activity
MAAGWRLLAQVLWFVTVACLAAGWFLGNGNLKALGVAMFALSGATAYAARARAERAKRERQDEPIVPR